MHVYLVIYSSLFRVSSFLLIFSLCFWFLFYLPVYQAIEEEASCRQVFSLLLLCMFVSVLFVSICKVLILFVVMHVFFLIIVIFSYWFFNSVFGSFLFSGAIDEEASSRQVFSPFAVMHVCFITICFYLQGFNFVCCYACFFLNNSYFFLLIFQLCFWFLFIFPGYRQRSIQQASFFSLLLLCMFVSLLFVPICKVLILFIFMHVFFLTNSYFFGLWLWTWLPDMVFNNGTMHALLFQ